MLGLVDSLPDKWLAFLWEQTVPHYCLTCFSVPIGVSVYINSFGRAKESLLGSSISYTATLRTLPLSVIKDLKSSFLVFTSKNSRFPKPQNLPQLLLISTCFSSKMFLTFLWIFRWPN